MTKIKWGILGVGDVCEVKSAPAMNLIEHSEITAVMRRDGKKAEDYARRHGVPKWYDDADQLINDPDVNAIYIATPPAAHKELAVKVAKAGKPAYVEKPMARTHEECQEMISAFKAAGVPLFVAYYRRCLPNFLKVKDLIDSGTIGEVRMVEVRMFKPLEPDIITHQENHWRVNPEVSGGGYFYDLASHQLDFLDYLLGPIKNARGFAANQAGRYPAEDIVTACFEFQSGVLGTGSWCFTSGESSDTEIITVIGSKGQVSFQTFGNHAVKLKVDGQEEHVFEFTVPKHIQQPLIQRVVDDLLGGSPAPSTGESGARTNQVMEWCAQSIS